jgi:hypothetical protein
VVVLEPGIIITEFGDVMLKNITRFSSKGAYADLTSKLVTSTQNLYDKGQGSKASVIAQTLSKIVAAKKPKTRYRVGQWAKPMVWMRIYLGDKLFDKIIMSQVK